MPAKYEEPKWGLKDCFTRLLYKISSQKIIAFVFAAAAMFTVLVFAYKAGTLTADVAKDALTGVKEIAIALLVVRLGQGAVAKIAGKAKTNGGDNDQES